MPQTLAGALGDTWCPSLLTPVSPRGPNHSHYPFRAQADCGRAPGTIFFFYSSSIFFCPSLRSTALTLQPPAAS